MEQETIHQILQSSKVGVHAKSFHDQSRN